MTEPAYPTVEIVRGDVNAETKAWLKEQSKDFERQRIERLKREEAAAVAGKQVDKLYFLVTKVGDRHYHGECVSGAPDQRQNDGTYAPMKLEAYGVSPDDVLFNARMHFAWALQGSLIERDGEAARARGAEAQLFVADVVGG